MPSLGNNAGAEPLPDRAIVPRSAPIPAPRLAVLFPRQATTVDKRAPAAASSSAALPTKSCGPNDNSGYCQKYVGATANTTLPIVLGVLIPLAVAFVVFAVLHRRHVKKLRQEDANDRHKSLDFGMDEVGGPEEGKTRKKKGSPPMDMTEKMGGPRRGRGLSLDMGVANSYLLPPELEHSRASIHSLSRAMTNEDDKYARATSFRQPDDDSPYPTSLGRGRDDSSSFTGSSLRTGLTDVDSSHNLVRSARPFDSSPAPAPAPNRLLKPSASAPKGDSLLPGAQDQARASYMSTASSNGASAALRASNNYLGAFIHGGFASEEKQRDSATSPTPPAKENEPTSQQLPRHELHEQNSEVVRPSQPTVEQSSTAQHNFQPTVLERREPGPKRLSVQAPRTEALPSLPPTIAVPEISLNDTSDVHNEHNVPQVDFANHADFVDVDDYDDLRASTEIRPLPPDDPSENPEQRANRIRSFYKEYFEESKAGPKPVPHNYYDGSEDFSHSGHAYDPAYYAEDSQVYDDGYNDGYYPPRPHAVDDFSRARTPPPRGPPRFMGTAHKPRSMSGGSFVPGRPKAYTTSSGQFGSPAGGPMLKKRPTAPPAPLHVLPTPHMLKDDVILPIDFAPPNSYRERRAGTPDSPKGGVRPFSPSLTAHVPLASSFDDLSVMPSPHALRKSGTFTALDFARVPRFSSMAGGSDAGSIRSNRTGMSTAQLHSIRAGAYRVSRIPAELAGTKDDLSSALKPQWGMRP